MNAAESRGPGLRVGLGTDNHRLEPGLPLWIGGVEIPAEVGCVAHSDGDVLLHALTDALLGAIGAGDIGEHFPDSDPRWKGESSSRFVEEARLRVEAAGYRIVNVDAVVTLERVRLKEFKRAIAERVGELLGATGRVNVKAKTNERCDAIGEGRAIAAQVVVLLAS